MRQFRRANNHRGEHLQSYELRTDKKEWPVCCRMEPTILARASRSSHKQVKSEN